MNLRALVSAFFWLSLLALLAGCEQQGNVTPTPEPAHEPQPPPSSGSGQGYAIAIGLYEVDPTHYYPTPPRLPGCEPDARDMSQIAERQGFKVTTLLTQAATRSAVLDVLAEHAAKLYPSDLLVVSYSGHGGQVADRNGDETDDGLDETWCLYDGMLLDDEIYDAWTKFKAGVRILVFSDSCHSGTVMRMGKPDVVGTERTHVKTLDREWNVLRRPVDLDRTRLLNAPAMRSAVNRDAVLRRRIESHPTIRREAGGRFVFMEPRDTPGVPTTQDDLFVARALSPLQVVDTYLRHKEMYDQIGDAIPGERTVPVQATVLLIAGCEDSQTSMDWVSNGLFTMMLKVVWSDGQFRGNHSDFHAAIKQKVMAFRRDQAPHYDKIGLNPSFESQRPYTVR